MSALLILGITTQLTIEKQKALKSFKTLDFIREYINKEFYAEELYDVDEDDEKIVYKVKREILDRELISLSTDFYNYFPADETDEETKQQLLQFLANCTNVDALLSKVSSEETDFFPFMNYYDHEEYIANDNEHYDASTKFLDFASFCKVLETGYFPFVEKLIRDVFGKYQLAKILKLNISC